MPDPCSLHLSWQSVFCPLQPRLSESHHSDHKPGFTWQEPLLGLSLCSPTPDTMLEKTHLHRVMYLCQ